VFETGKYKMESIAGTAVGEVNLYLCCRQGNYIWPRGRRPRLRSGSDSYEPCIGFRYRQLYPSGRCRAVSSASSIGSVHGGDGRRACAGG
jgi:hypothetical protein